MVHLGWMRGDRGLQQYWMTICFGIHFALGVSHRRGTKDCCVSTYCYDAGRSLSSYPCRGASREERTVAKTAGSFQ